jgi:hypothetical protein
VHTTLRLTKAERITFRRHFPAWFSISLRPASPKVYVRVGDRAYVWLLDSLWTYHCAKNHGQSALRQRIGGSPPELWRDDPLLQVEAWAADEGTADLLIRTWVAALPDFRHRATTGEIHTYGIDSGPFWSPDDPTLSNNSRYIITVRLLTTV